MKNNKHINPSKEKIKVRRLGESINVHDFDGVLSDSIRLLEELMDKYDNQECVRLDYIADHAMYNLTYNELESNDEYAERMISLYKIEEDNKTTQSTLKQKKEDILNQMAELQKQLNDINNELY